jgi:hypothetical protein
MLEIVCHKPRKQFNRPLGQASNGSAEFSAGCSIEQLSTLGIIDQAFAEFVQDHPLTIDCISYHQLFTLTASLKKHA